MRTSSRTRFLSFASLAYIVSGAVRLCACVAFSMAVMGSGGEARAQLKPYEWVDIRIQSYHDQNNTDLASAVLLDVVAMNDRGDICGTYSLSGTKAFVYRMSEDRFYTLPLSSGSARVRDIDDNGTVVGWSTVSTTHTSRVWEYVEDGGIWDYEENTGFADSGEQLWSVTEDGLIVGNDMSGDTPQNGFIRKLSSSSYKLTLTVPSGYSTAAAQSIADSSAGGWVVAGYCGSGTSQKAVGWIGGASVTSVTVLSDSGGSYPWAGRKVSSQHAILGSKLDGSNHKYHLWEWNGSGWNSASDLSKSNPNDGSMVDFNEVFEFAQAKTMYYYNAADIRTAKVMDTDAWLTIPSYINSSSWRFYALDNRGVLAGKAQTTDTSPVQVLIIAVPRNDDNSTDGITIDDDAFAFSKPDYRDIYLSADSGSPNAFPVDDEPANWLLDKIYVPRPGLHAPGELTSAAVVGDLDDLFVVRNMTDTNEIDQFLSCEAACTATQNYLNEWGANDNSYTDRPKEIIYSIRSRITDDLGIEFPAELRPHIDWIPGPALQDEILADLADAARLYAPNIDYFQLGNEIYLGAGQYGFVDYDLPGGCSPSPYTGVFVDLPGCAVPQATADILDWIALQAEAVRVGACLGGRPARLIAPAVAYKFARKGINGNAAGDLDVEANRNAYAISELVELANDNNWICDFHMWFSDIDEMEDMATYLKQGGYDGNEWEDPTYIACLEFGAVPSQPDDDENNEDDHVDWWQGKSGALLLEAMTDEDGGNNPEASWADFVSAWLDEDNDASTGLANLPDSPDFIETGLDALETLDFRVACFAPVAQYGDLSEFWMSALRPTEHYPLETPEVMSEFAGRLETALENLDFDGMLTTPGWDPHPELCDVECPESCE